MKSSNLHSVGYDEITSTLEVTFLSKETYRFTNVPASVHRKLMSATSKGSYFSANIRNKYNYEKL